MYAVVELCQEFERANRGPKKRKKIPISKNSPYWSFVIRVGTSVLFFPGLQEKAQMEE